MQIYELVDLACTTTCVSWHRSPLPTCFAWYVIRPYTTWSTAACSIAFFSNSSCNVNRACLSILETFLIALSSRLAFWYHALKILLTHFWTTLQCKIEADYGKRKVLSGCAVDKVSCTTFFFFRHPAPSANPPQLSYGLVSISFIRFFFFIDSYERKKCPGHFCPRYEAGCSRRCGAVHFFTTSCHGSVLNNCWVRLLGFATGFRVRTWQKCLRKCGRGYHWLTVERALWTISGKLCTPCNIQKRYGRRDGARRGRCEKRRARWTILFTAANLTEVLDYHIRRCKDEVPGLEEDECGLMKKCLKVFNPGW